MDGAYAKLVWDAQWSASLMRYRAALSLTEPPGFMNSALTAMVQPVSSLSLFRRISGVQVNTRIHIHVDTCLSLHVSSGTLCACAVE